MPWNPSDEQLEQLKTGWTVEGLSASQLAQAFGVTRNVVIGHVHRRGWQQAGGGARAQRVRPLLPMAPKTRQAPATPAAPKKMALVLDPENFVVFDQLGPHHCRYPVDAGGKAGLYCGLMPNGTPYCEGHAAIVYQPHLPPKKKKPRR